MASNPLFVAVRVHGATSDAVRESVEAMPLADPIDGRVGCLDVVVALQVPDNAYRPHVVGPAQVQNLVHDLISRFVRVIVGAAPPTSQPLLAEFTISVPPEVAGRSRDPEVSESTAGGRDVVAMAAEVKSYPPADSGHRQPGDDGEAIVAIPVRDPRCLSARSPGPPKRRDQEEPRLVETDEVRLPARCVFFTWGQRVRFQRSMRSSSRSSARRSGFWGLKPS